jgi:hypothetical protein
MEHRGATDRQLLPVGNNTSYQGSKQRLPIISSYRLVYEIPSLLADLDGIGEWFRLHPFHDPRLGITLHPTEQDQEMP